MSNNKVINLQKYKIQKFLQKSNVKSDAIKRAIQRAKERGW